MRSPTKKKLEKNLDNPEKSIIFVTERETNKDTENMNYNHMTESDKILHILDIMGAVSPETAVTTEQMVGKGIEEGATQDIFTRTGMVTQRVITPGGSSWRQCPAQGPRRRWRSMMYLISTGRKSLG